MFSKDKGYGQERDKCPLGRFIGKVHILEAKGSDPTNASKGLDLSHVCFTHPVWLVR